MLVSISIIALISGVIIFQYSKFDSQVLLRNVAYEVALTVREAQVLAVSVRGNSSDFDQAYGVHFTKDSPTYQLFRDSGTVPRTFDGGDQILATYTISRGTTIGVLCKNATTCASSASLPDEDVTFKRPDPDATFAHNSVLDPISSLGIVVTSNKDPSSMRVVEVMTTGQISVQ